MIKKNLSIAGLAFVAIAGVISLSHCGGSGGSSTGIDGNTSLADIPSASTIAASNASSYVSKAILAKAFEWDRGLISNFRPDVTLQSTGTPEIFPTVAANVDADIFGGEIAEIKGTAGGSVTSTMAQKFFGQVKGGPAGQPGCFQLQNVAANLGHALSAGNTTCYLKNIAATETSGITVSGANQKEMFIQGADTTLSKMTISNMPNDHRDDRSAGSMVIFLTNYGKKDVGGDTYKIQLDFCQSGTHKQSEVLQFNRGDGTFSDVSKGSMDGQGTQYSSLTASIHKGGRGSFEFDKSKPRNFDYYYSFSYLGQDQSNAGKLSIQYADGKDMMESWGHFKGTWGTQDVYGASIFTGSGPSDLRIYDAATNGSFTNVFSGTTYRSKFSGNIAWTNSSYTSGSADSHVTAKTGAETIATDTFFTGAAPTTTVDTFDCSRTDNTVTATMDFSVPAVLAIKTTCDSDKVDQSLWTMCNSTDIMADQQKAMINGGFHD